MKEKDENNKNKKKIDNSHVLKYTKAKSIRKFPYLKIYKEKEEAKTKYISFISAATHTKRA